VKSFLKGINRTSLKEQELRSEISHGSYLRGAGKLPLLAGKTPFGGELGSSKLVARVVLWGTFKREKKVGDRVSLHSFSDGKRLTQQAKPTDLTFYSFNSFRMRLLPALNGGVSTALENR
jgi:hypothetical protein